MKNTAKIILLTLLFIFSTGLTFAQSESIDSKTTIAKFVQYYNGNQQDSIFYIFSPKTQQELPLEKTKAFLNQLKNRYGNIKQVDFQSYQNGFGVYKTELDKGLLTLNIAVDNNKAITGLFAKPYEATLEAKLPRNITPMQLPFKGEWTVFWGGDTKEQNYHVAVNFQKNAFDIIINNPQGKSYKTDGKTNEDYYAFAQPLLAPSDGEIVLAVDGIKDNIPGKLNPMFTTGNSVLIKTKNNEYILFAHFKQNTISVKQGDRVKQGQQLGLCGNSGNSSEPHLHFHIQDAEDFYNTVGVKCYFDKLQVNGTSKTDYSPVKGDKIKMAN
ncbi:MAG: DUF3887 domain-containing protein [Pedobacter sp.]|nr:MAG: DUF3887 domain-containing protein [Pedobacter sp.]